MKKRKMTLCIPNDRYELLNYALANKSMVSDLYNRRLFIEFDISKREVLEICVEYEFNDVFARISTYSSETGTCIEYLHEGDCFPWQLNVKRREIPLEFSIRDTLYNISVVVDPRAKKPHVLTESGKRSRTEVREASIFTD